MAIKITKAGQKEFHGFCKWCGCEFTYEISDLKLSATGDKLDCPTCGKTYHHNMMVQDPTIPGGIGRLQTWPPEPIPCTPDMTKTDPCAGCAWRENLLRDGLYIGDTPCTWCNKNRFNTATCTSIQGTSTLEQYINPDIKDLDAKYTSSTSCDTNGTKYTTAYSNAEDITQGTVMQTILNACGCNCGDTEGKATETAAEATQANDNHACCSGKKNCKGKH